MEEIATSTIVSIANSGSFWQDIPAAAYVLIGVFISGILAIFSDLFSDRRNIKNSKELKELENKNNKEIQVLEITHKEKLQELEESGEKTLRLLDAKLATFSDFHNYYSEMSLGATTEIRLEKIGMLRKTGYKAQLLVPSLKDRLLALDYKLIEYETHFFNIKNGTDTRTPAEKESEKTRLAGEVYALIHPILDLLAGEL